LARRCQNAQLQRIYGTAWRDKKELDAYVERLAEAEKATIASWPRTGAFHFLAGMSARPAFNGCPTAW